MAGTRYSPIASLLPSVYQEDEHSFDQIDSFLGLVDHLHRSRAARLEEMASWLSPAATAFEWPADVPFDAGADPVIAAYERLFDELAKLTAFRFPDWWTVEVDGDVQPDLERRRHYLTNAARLWRRRHTPRGFLAWLVLAFGIEPDAVPFLLEHFKFGRPECEDAPEPGPEPGLRATLLVPSTDDFDNAERRRLLERFVLRYSPAHVHVRVCWVAEDFWIYDADDGDGGIERRELPGPRPDKPEDPADVPAWELEVAAWELAVQQFRTHVQCLLCALVDETPHGLGLKVRACIDVGGAEDRLGIGRLPTDETE